MTPDCIFCKIANRSIPAPLVYEDSEVVAFQDLNPQAAHHILVIPREHFTDVGDAAAAGQSALLGKIFATAAHLASERGLSTGYRLVTNTGKDGGQTVRHLHVHLLGGRPMGWPPG